MNDDALLFFLAAAGLVLGMMVFYTIAGWLCDALGFVSEIWRWARARDAEDMECPEDAIFCDELEEDFERPWLHDRPADGWRPLSRPEFPTDEAHAAARAALDAPSTKPNAPTHPAELAVSP